MKNHHQKFQKSTILIKLCYCLLPFREKHRSKLVNGFKISTMKNRVIELLLLICISISVEAAKTVYIPSSIRNKMDLNSSSSQWCYSRSSESDNVVVFWESGFGNNPSNSSGNYKVNINTLLDVAEKAYAIYLDTLKFAIRGSSVTDKYKLIIFLTYSTDWEANGSGEDDQVGTLRVSAWAAKVDNVVAHEIGHCFQYITGCDSDGGYRYGLGDNGKGGNGFWEQCAQWLSFKVYPEKQFTENDFNVYIKSNHLHILHESPRYANYFLPDFWTYKHGITFIGKLWRDSRFPEDPVQTYKRLHSLSQEQFNDEMYEHAARLTTWDIPAIEQYGKKYTDSRAQVKMNNSSDRFWRIDSSGCVENYGYNSIKLNPPAVSKEITVTFRGKAGTNGYRTISKEKGGWRFGFVALLENDTRVYSETGTAIVKDGLNPDQTLTFVCPDECKKLWLVVSGAPQEHWKHEWDDTTFNDEQWPYEVAFTNTNMIGINTDTKYTISKRIEDSFKLVNRYGRIILPRQGMWRITSLTGQEVLSGFGNSIDVRPYATGGYVLNYNGKSRRILMGPLMKCEM